MRSLGQPVGSLAADFAGNEFVYWIGEYTIVRNSAYTDEKQRQ